MGPEEGAKMAISPCQVKQRHVSPSEQELKREAEDVTLSDAGFSLSPWT